MKYFMQQSYSSKLIYLTCILFAALVSISAHSQDDIYIVIGGGMSFQKAPIEARKEIKILTPVSLNVMIGVGKIKDQLRAEFLFGGFKVQSLISQQSLTVSNITEFYSIGVKGYYDFLNINDITIYLTAGTGLVYAHEINEKTGLRKSQSGNYAEVGAGYHFRIQENLKIAAEYTYRSLSIQYPICDNNNLTLALIFDL